MKKSDFCIRLCNTQGLGNYARRRMINSVTKRQTCVFKPLIILYTVTVFLFKGKAKFRKIY